MLVLISNEAHENISSVFNYISNHSLKYANETSSSLYSKISQLETFPYLGRYVPEFSNKLYRELLYKSYRIIYSIYEEIDTVYIHLVVHDKRNLYSILYVK